MLVLFISYFIHILQHFVYDMNIVDYFVYDMNIVEIVRHEPSGLLKYNRGERVIVLCGNLEILIVMILE